MRGSTSLGGCLLGQLGGAPAGRVGVHDDHALGDALGRRPRGGRALTHGRHDRRYDLDSRARTVPERGTTDARERLPFGAVTDTAPSTTSFATLFESIVGNIATRRARQARGDRVRGDGAARRGPPPDRGRARRRQDQPRQGARRRRSTARGSASSSPPTCCRPTSSASASTNARTERFRFQPGPLFANIVLADEINRASPKTQSALLEAMEERQVSADGTTHVLPPPFMVIATQNPVEQEGTYRLPESQLDRFLLRISLGYPGRTAEMEILDGQGAADVLRELQPVVTTEEVLAMVRSVREVYLASALKSYMIDIAEASRRHSSIELGLSPRATLQLAAAVRAHAAAQGRDYGTPDDVKAVAVSRAVPPPAAARRQQRPHVGRGLDARAARRRPRPGRPLTGTRPVPTRQGWTVAVGARRRARDRPRVRRSSSCSWSAPGSALAVVLAVLTVRFRRPNLAIGRWIHPTVLTVGDTGRVDLLIENRGKRRSPPADLTEPVGANSTAQMAIAALPAGARVTAGYRVPAARRGVLLVGPTMLAPARPARARRRHPDRRRCDRDHRRTADVRAADAVARQRRARPPPAGALATDRPRRVPQPARLRHRRRAALDPLEGVGPVRGAQGSPARGAGRAPLHHRARPRRRRLPGTGHRSPRPTCSSGRSSPPAASC